MIVELDVFSGRPAPRWRLDDAAERELVALHRRLATLAEPPEAPPGLGYRGFVYHLEGSEWRAWRGTVASAGRVLADPTRAVERLLLAALPADYADLRPRLGQEIDQGG